MLGRYYSVQFDDSIYKAFTKLRKIKENTTYLEVPELESILESISEIKLLEVKEASTS